MAGPLADAGEAVARALGSFQPENVQDFRDVFASLTDFFDIVAQGLNNMADHMDNEEAVSPAIGEGFREMVAGAGGLYAQAEELQSTFETAHADKLDRIDNPRPAEEMWDVANQE
jgi:hypothetical protein